MVQSTGVSVPNAHTPELHDSRNSDAETQRGSGELGGLYSRPHCETHGCFWVSCGVVCSAVRLSSSSLSFFPYFFLSFSLPLVRFKKKADSTNRNQMKKPTQASLSSFHRQRSQGRTRRGPGVDSTNSLRVKERKKRRYHARTDTQVSFGLRSPHLHSVAVQVGLPSEERRLTDQRQEMTQADERVVPSICLPSGWTSTRVVCAGCRRAR